MKIALHALFITFAILSLAMGQGGPQEAGTTPEEAKAWSDTIGYIFDQWWDRVLLVLSMLANFGLLTKKGQDIANDLNPLNKKKK